MAQEFDGRSFEHLLSDAERCLSAALDHERELSALIDRVEGHPDFDVLPALRALCVAARRQRQLVETIVRRMAGDGARGNGHGPGRPRVLVVDDATDNRELAAVTLEAAGFDLITATNGLEGVIVAHYARPAVVLMDVAMPVLDGLAAARLLKASEVTRDLKLIAYTATPDFCEGPVAKLFVDVLAKPADPATIVASVRRHIIDTG
jgi:CheY-like chemotaxis protein